LDLLETIRYLYTRGTNCGTQTLGIWIEVWIKELAHLESGDTGEAAEWLSARPNSIPPAPLGDSSGDSIKPHLAMPTGATRGARLQTITPPQLGQDFQQSLKSRTSHQASDPGQSAGKECSCPAD
jgi:hypothetical protein